MAFVELVTLVVDDYDDAIRFFVDVLAFDLVEDVPATTNGGRKPSEHAGRDGGAVDAPRCERSGFRPKGHGRAKRWVVVRPPGAVTGLLLAQADGERQGAVVGDQTAGRVGFFLRVDDFDAAYARMLKHGVVFTSPPRTEPYGRVAVFVDVAGNKWDLLGPRSEG